MENKLSYPYSNSAGKPVSNSNSPYIKKIFNEIFSEIPNLGTEESSVYFLSLLFIMSGFLLFIYGLFTVHLYQFVMGFVFLISGFIMDSTTESETRR